MNLATDQSVCDSLPYRASTSSRWGCHARIIGSTGSVLCVDEGSVAYLLDAGLAVCDVLAHSVCMCGMASLPFHHCVCECVFMSWLCDCSMVCTPMNFFVHIRTNVYIYIYICIFIYIYINRVVTR